MFSENEIAMMIELPGVHSAIAQTKENFIQREAQFLEISEHDFLSLVMLTPAIGIALANGTISLMEELALNKMARKMSKGGFFLKADPVVHAMKFLIKRFDRWEATFHELIKVVMSKTFDNTSLKAAKKNNEKSTLTSFAQELMQVPYILVRYINSFFLLEEVEIVDEKSISKVEYEKVIDIGNKLELSRHEVFKSFCATFTVR